MERNVKRLEGNIAETDSRLQGISTKFSAILESSDNELPIEIQELYRNIVLMAKATYDIEREQACSLIVIKYNSIISKKTELQLSDKHWELIDEFWNLFYLYIERRQKKEAWIQKFLQHVLQSKNQNIIDEAINYANGNT